MPAEQESSCFHLWLANQGRGGLRVFGRGDWTGSMAGARAAHSHTLENPRAYVLSRQRDGAQLTGFTIPIPT